MSATYYEELRALLLSAADDLDRLEELEPEPGRVGRANHLRRFSKSWRLRTDFRVSDGGSEHIAIREMDEAQNWYWQTNELVDAGLSKKAQENIQRAFRAMRIHRSHLVSCHGMKPDGGSET